MGGLGGMYAGGMAGGMGMGGIGGSSFGGPMGGLGGVGAMGGIGGMGMGPPLGGVGGMGMPMGGMPGIPGMPGMGMQTRKTGNNNAVTFKKRLGGGQFGEVRKAPNFLPTLPLAFVRSAEKPALFHPPATWDPCGHTTLPHPWSGAGWLHL